MRVVEERGDRFTAIEDRFAGYTVYDLFVDESDQSEYIGVRTGFLGTRSTLIPIRSSESRSPRTKPRSRTVRASTTTGR
jgi:hypothetical protein